MQKNTVEELEAWYSVNKSLDNVPNELFYYFCTNSNNHRNTKQSKELHTWGY